MDGGVVVEVKAGDRLAPIQTAQLLTYLRLTDARHALLFNFNALTLKDGMKSFVGGKGSSFPASPATGDK